MRILFFAGELSPYRLARFAALHDRGAHTVTVTVAEASVDKHGFDDTARKRYEVPIYAGEAPACEWSAKELSKGNFDVAIVHGYAIPEVRRVTRAAKKAGVPVVMVLENTAYDRRRPFWKEWLKRAYIRKYVDYMFVPGERAAEYAHALGMKRSRVWRGLFAVDVDYYAEEARKAGDDAASQRAGLHLPDRFFLFCGWLRDVKNVCNLVKAYGLYRKRVSAPWDLVLLGKGDRETDIRAMDVPGVDLRGFIQLDELPRYYGLASCFCIVSNSDPWPLAMLEAIACGLPVIASWKCGNTVELIREGWNGWVCDPDSIGSIAECMVVAHGDEATRETARSEGLGLASGYTVDAWARKTDYYLDRLASGAGG
ncbi:MAG: glycosyltransferase family 4 protein [Planctomycetota bacterium]